MKIKESKKPATSSEKQKPIVSKTPEFAFGKQNYKLLLIGLGFIFVGFILMIGGGSDDPNVFSDKIFNFRRLTLAPILILTGYVIEIFAIMKKPKDID
ncbi:MAG: DUF3098 domain-containing protein [Bacteroidales bacterium]|nr:DUF3098 domain-containing protein [Bacteroidales bacterium]